MTNNENYYEDEYYNEYVNEAMDAVFMEDNPGVPWDKMDADKRIEWFAEQDAKLKNSLAELVKVSAEMRAIFGGSTD